MANKLYKYWVYQNTLISLVEDWSRIQEPLPEGWAVYDSTTLLPGDPHEYRLDDGALVRIPPPPPPNALQRAMSTDSNVLSALEKMRQSNPIAALLVQLSIAHLEQNLNLAESALTGLITEMSKGRDSNTAPSATPTATPTPTPAPSASPTPAPSPSTSSAGTIIGTKVTK